MGTVEHSNIVAVPLREGSRPYYCEVYIAPKLIFNNSGKHFSPVLQNKNRFFLVNDSGQSGLQFLGGAPSASPSVGVWGTL